MANQKDNQSIDDQDQLSDDQLKDVAGGVLPPSGNDNPSNLGNRTVDTGDIINPQPH